MKRLFATFAAVAVLAAAGCGASQTSTDQSTSTTTAGAQAGAPGQGGRQRFGQLLLSLNLSDAQRQQVRAIMKAARDKNQSITDPQVKRANMRAAFAQVDTVLTPDQRTTLHAKMQAARKPQPTN